jgi:hypothetical protein
MSPDRKTRLILLFGQNTDHPFFPAKVLTAGARSGGQEPALGQRSEGQPSGQGRQRFPLTASTMAALRALRAMLFMVAIFASSMLLSDSAHTPASVAGHTSSIYPTIPSRLLSPRASKRFRMAEQWIRAMLQVESGGKLRVRSQHGAPCGSCGSCQGPGLNCALATVLALIPTIHTTTSWRVPFTSASYMIIAARRTLWAPTMPGLGATGDGSSVAGETQAYVATPAPMIERIRTGGKAAAVAKSFTWASSSFFVLRTASISAVSRTPHGCAPESLSERPCCCRSIGAGSAAGQPVRAPWQRGSIAMIQIHIIAVYRGSSHTLMWGSGSEETRATDGEPQMAR